MSTMPIPQFMVVRETGIEPDSIPDWDHDLTATLEKRKHPVTKTVASRDGVLSKEHQVAVMFSSEEMANKFINLHPEANWKILRLDDDVLLKLFDRPECLERFGYIAVDHVDDQSGQENYRRCVFFEPQSAVAALKKYSPDGRRWVEEFTGFIERLDAIKN